MSKSKMILIIDDDKSVRELLHGFLKLGGFKTHSVDNGIAALSIIKKRHFDIIITDYSMPLMNGIELVKKIRPDYPDCLIVGISGNCNANDFLQAGANAFLPKPLDIQELLSIVSG